MARRLQPASVTTSPALREPAEAPPPDAAMRVRPQPPSALRAVSATMHAAPQSYVLYSTAVEGDISKMLGRPHYSYRFAEQKFIAAFAQAKRRLQLLRMPEYYATRSALPLPQDVQDHALVHLIFRSTEEIRLLKAGYNICCFAWEFEVLKDSTGPGEHPFLNQHRMLSICDEVWVPCSFTRDVLRAHGVDNVHIVPAPIPLPTAPRLERSEALAAVGQIGVMPLVYNFLLSHQDNARAAAARSQSLIDWLAPKLGADPNTLVYLSVLNPEDFRKNLDSLLRGFHYFQQANPAACLIVKVLTSTERFSLDRVIAEVVPHKLASGSVFDTDNIVFVNRYLPDDEMAALYALADFYLSPSIAEGQNLPLLEAMALGTVPVSTANTAMADYITPDNAFVIESKRVPTPTEHLAGTIARKPFKVNLSGPRDVYSALLRSARATRAQRRAMAAAASAAVREKFSPEAVWPLIEARLAAVVAQQGAKQDRVGVAA